MVESVDRGFDISADAGPTQGAWEWETSAGDGLIRADGLGGGSPRAASSGDPTMSRVKELKLEGYVKVVRT